MIPTPADLVRLYDERVTLAKAFAADPAPTGAMADAIMAKADELDAACEIYRKAHHPRAGRVAVGLWAVFVQSPSRRKTTTILDLFDTYRGEVPA